MPRHYIHQLKRGLSRIGNKAANLRLLESRGFTVPSTYVCTWDAYERYLRDDVSLIEELRKELADTIDPSRTYAIRSSANLEDSKLLSFAGQFKTVLNVQGIDDVLGAIGSIWATTRTPSVKSYLNKHDIDPRDLLMAVLIQEMVPPQVSGVAFSKNPMTGMDEVIVEAVHGSGEALVQEGATPQRWVNKWGVWTTQPEADGIDLDVIGQVVEQTKAIAKAYGHPVDLEWVYDGASVHWVQLREITALDIDLYCNHISREVFPGLIKPLIWSVNVPLVNGAWVRMFTELIGPNDLDPGSLAKSFYGRAYFNMRTIGQIFEMLGMPRESLEMLMGISLPGADKPSFRPGPRTFRHFPRMLAFALKKLAFARDVASFLPKARTQYDTFAVKPLNDLSENELLDEIDRLYDLTQQVAYYNVITALLMQLYHALLKAGLDAAGIDIKSIDITGGLKEAKEYDPNAHLAHLYNLYSQLDPAMQDHISKGTYTSFAQLDGVDELQHKVGRFLTQFGHLSDSGNDFSAVPWRENPDLVLDMIIAYKPSLDRTESRKRFKELDLSASRRTLLGILHRRARQFQLYREAVSSTYTYGYGLFRNYFLALGDRLVSRRVLSARDNVFYLTFDEVREIVEHSQEPEKVEQLIEQRKAEMEQSQDLVPPSIIYGDGPVLVENVQSDRLSGVPTSRGQYTGPTKVVRGVSDFAKIQEGDVLVIPYSDVGWTPLFAQAGAVIAESGGMLSHSSIVAREYDIPAVVSVSGATLLADKTSVTVDGYTGEIVIH